MKIKNIIHNILSTKNKTNEDINNLLSKFNNTKIDNISIHQYIIINNRKHNFNLSPNQIMSIIEKADLFAQNSFSWTLPMYVLYYNKDQNLNLNPNQIMSIIEKYDHSISFIDKSTIIDHILILNKNQNLNLSANQIMSLIKKTNLSSLNNEFLNIFFSTLGKQFDMSENQIYKTMKLLKKKYYKDDS